MNFTAFKAELVWVLAIANIIMGVSFIGIDIAPNLGLCVAALLLVNLGLIAERFLKAVGASPNNQTLAGCVVGAVIFCLMLHGNLYRDRVIVEAMFGGFLLFFSGIIVFLSFMPPRDPNEHVDP